MDTQLTHGPCKTIGLSSGDGGAERGTGNMTAVLGLLASSHIIKIVLR